MSAGFVHLRFHSEYSITDGIVRLDPILEEVAHQGGVALGITDSMNIFGALRFYSHAIADGIKPIVGCDLWVTNLEADKRDHPHRLTVYCQNHQGYLKLCELLSKGWMENQWLGRGEVRLDWLTEENCQGLICLSGGPLGIIEKHIVAKKYEEAEAITRQLMKAFPDRLYIDLQRAGRKNDDAIASKMANFAVKMNLPPVATHPIQFLKPEDFRAHEVRCCISGGYVLADTRRPKDFSSEQYLKTEEEMRALFADIPQAIENTVVIAERCSLDGVLQKPQLPVFPTPDGMSLDDYMVQLSYEGLEKRLEFLYPDVAERDARRPEYKERLKYELDTIIKMKFPGYFLIVQDFINWSKRNGVAVGPGRGSGAGSLVAYVLGITDLDPLHYGLLFERFLNPERVSMPDFDIDFCQHNRDRTIEYVKRTYGKEAVSQIVTFGAMGAKAVVRDVGRVLNMGYGKVDDLAKLIPQKPGADINLTKAAEMEPDFKAKAESEEYRELMSYATELEGLTRNLGMHAGGVLIAPGKLTDFCPLYNADGRPENTVSQYDKKDVENVGLVKFDFLGLTTLTILGKAVEYIDRLNPGTHFDLSRIPTDDKATLELFQA
ncbi:MAG: DNA polymerase III subunit alpha, partial [Sutterellaceae bacterium]|nr:DNA polymerase III subunit alpha [Sutterellaceae bacterium]